MNLVGLFLFLWPLQGERLERQKRKELIQEERSGIASTMISVEDDLEQFYPSRTQVTDITEGHGFFVGEQQQDKQT